MSSALAVAAVLAGLASLAPPAGAAPGAGAPCEFVRTNAYQVISHGRTGVVSAGPYAVPGASSVTLTCVVQRNSTDPAAPDAARVSGTTSGSVGLLVAADVRYVAAPHDTAYICTEVAWTGTTSGRSWLGCQVIPLG